MPVVGRAPLAAGCSGRASPGKAKPHPLDGAQLVEKAALLRQAAYEQGLRPRSPRTARGYFK